MSYPFVEGDRLVYSRMNPDSRTVVKVPGTFVRWQLSGHAGRMMYVIRLDSKPNQPITVSPKSVAKA